ncbi:aspartyl protease family protein [Erythrobacter crassostreae]|uniref:Aspartyl protease family protein n=1 Tax=Erythrobacter crassostreae TaxID=2828328 RepID=A0A9X1JP62_9SPHN|nr:aspartyl protease family protein [Erythrobacter crassostrea]MBV7259102.1 aspartyl protease family protein [Erythrobacter crassostrea]
MRTLLALSAMPLALVTAASHANTVEPPAPIKSLTQESIAPDLANPNTEILPLEEERHRRLTIPVTIEGAGPYDFMIDTGSQATAVTHKINDSLSLTPLGTATLVGMASRRPVNLVEVNNLVVGSHTIHNLTAPVLNSSHVGADGIIGLDSLQDFRVLIDFRNETIALEDMTKKQSRSGFEIIVKARQKLGQLLITDAVVEGVRATVIIDTGAQSSLANNALRDRIRARRSQEVTTMDVNGVTMVGDVANIRSLKIQGLALTNVPLAFADAPAFEALGLKDKPVLSLGMQHLKIFDRVAIDFANKRIMFDVPRDIARALRKSKREGAIRPFNR